jgi:hypothetical protein
MNARGTQVLEKPDSLAWYAPPFLLQGSLSVDCGTHLKPSVAQFPELPSMTSLSRETLNVLREWPAVDRFNLQ